MDLTRDAVGGKAFFPDSDYFETADDVVNYLKVFKQSYKAPLSYLIEQKRLLLSGVRERESGHGAQPTDLEIRRLLQET